MPARVDVNRARTKDPSSPAELRGTPGYLAPELFTEAVVDRRLADIYSTGIVLYNLVSCAQRWGARRGALAKVRRLWVCRRRARAVSLRRAFEGLWVQHFWPFWGCSVRSL